MKQKISSNNLIGIILISIAFIVFIIKTFGILDNRNQVIAEYNKTVGVIKEYNIFGDGPSIHIKYEYNVSGKTYSRLVNGNITNNNSLSEGIDDYVGKKFLVIYSRKHPEKSLIDLSREIDKIQDIDIPKSLHNFQ